MALCGFSINVTFLISLLGAIQSLNNYKQSNRMVGQLLLKQKYLAMENQSTATWAFNAASGKSLGYSIPICCSNNQKNRLVWGCSPKQSLAIHHSMESQVYLFLSIVFIRYMHKEKLQRYINSPYLRLTHKRQPQCLLLVLLVVISLKNMDCFAILFT